MDDVASVVSSVDFEGFLREVESTDAVIGESGGGATACGGAAGGSCVVAGEGEASPQSH